MTYKAICTSSEYQIAREFQAVGINFVSETRVQGLLERRGREEAERARQRKAREARWAAIAAGEMDAFRVDQVLVMHSDLPDGRPTGRTRQARAAKLEAEGLDRLLDAATANAQEPVAA